MEFQNSNHLQRGPLFLPMLHCYGISNFGQPLYLTFCYLCILSSALRDCANSHGILTFIEFAT